MGFNLFFILSIREIQSTSQITMFGTILKNGARCYNYLVIPNARCHYFVRMPNHDHAFRTAAVIESHHIEMFRKHAFPVHGATDFVPYMSEHYGTSFMVGTCNERRRCCVFRNLWCCAWCLGARVA